MKVDADVAVIGAGPAGSAAAATLASHGMTTILVDRACFPRPKVCGDGLTPRALAALHRLGVWSRVEPYAQPVQAVRTVDLRTGATWSGPVPSRLAACGETGAVVRRDVLDDLLCRRAVEMGASFQGGVAIGRIIDEPDVYVISGRAGKRRWECATRAVVLAVGAGGRLAARFCGRRNATIEGIALRQYWRCESMTPTFTICVPLESTGKSYAGYGWIFPVGRDMANVGVGIYGTRDGRDLRRVYRQFLTRLCEVAPDLRGAEPCGAAQGGLLRSGGSAGGAVFGRLVLAGDAAAVTNPFTGEGIAQALDSGELAALSLLDEFRSPGCLETVMARRMRGTFPQTSRLAEHLPWLACRGQHFVAEFWGAVSPPSTLLAKAARRVALEEDLGPACRQTNRCIEHTWIQFADSIGGEFPLLLQLLEAARRESQSHIDTPLLSFWEAIESTNAPIASEVEVIAQLLLLATLMAVIAFEAGSERPAECATGERVIWASNALALGAADVLMAHFFASAARVPAALSAHCAGVLSQTLRALPGCADGVHDPGRMNALLGSLATGFKAAARACVATAA